MPGFRAGVIDANLQVRKTALQRDGSAFGAFSGIELGLDSPVDLKSEPCRWKLFGRRSHVDVREHAVGAMATVSPLSPARAFMRMPPIC